MKDYDKELVESARPPMAPQEAISYCLHRLHEEKEHRMADLVAPQLTYEDLIGALLMGQDAIKALAMLAPEGSHCAESVSAIPKDKSGQPLSKRPLPAKEYFSTCGSVSST